MLLVNRYSYFGPIILKGLRIFSYCQLVMNLELTTAFLEVGVIFQGYVIDLTLNDLNLSFSSDKTS